MAKHASNETASYSDRSGYQGRHRAEDGGRHETRDSQGQVIGWSAGREPRAPDNYNR